MDDYADVVHWKTSDDAVRKRLTHAFFDRGHEHTRDNTALA